MKSLTTKALALTFAASSAQVAVSAETLGEAFKESTAHGAFNLRYEDVGTAAGDVDMLSLRSRFGFTTGTLNGFSFMAEAEDVTYVLGIDGPLAYEPEVTEIDQAFVQYKTDAVTAKVGRQVITLDNHRYIGHVGWRQDRQTYDAARVMFSPAEGLSLDLSYIFQRNRIFGEAADAASSDFLLNASFASPIGKVVGYGYLLDDELRDEQSDTFGVRLTGTKGDETKFAYTLEYATQSITDSGVDADTDYMLAELGLTTSGITAKIGYEVLGSDDGAASFTTPLATLHAFNGWADVFLGGTFNPAGMPNGLTDTYVSLAGSVAGVNVAAFYRDFSADFGSADYGSEFDIVATKSFGGGVTGGIKYADYSDDGFLGTDKDVLWIWTSYSF